MFLIVDVNNIAARAFYTSKNSLFSMVRTAMSDVGATHLALCFDSEETWRKGEFPDYKATRKPDDGMRDFVDEAKTAFTLAGLPVVSVSGYEADDVANTLSFLSLWSDMSAVVFSSDKDLFLCACKEESSLTSISILSPGKSFTYDRKRMYQSDICDIMGVEIWQLPFLKALCGESTDNIPGIPGVGPVSARNLVNVYQTYTVLIDSFLYGTDIPLDNKSVRKFLDNPEGKHNFLLYYRISCLSYVDEIGHKFNQADYSKWDDGMFSRAAEILFK